jgi:WhiB family transcriptional regulator, redox-sensing transcriptional regulator
MQRSATLRRDDIGLPLPCCTRDADLFFAESPADVEYAKALCRACPIRRECLNEALQRREPWGVWGGELLVNGTIVARKRTRGRPRKSRDQEDTATTRVERPMMKQTTDQTVPTTSMRRMGGYGAAIAMIPYLLISLQMC